MRFDPGHQFARTEGFRHVIVAADLEAENAVDFIRPGGEKNDGRARDFSGLPNLPAKIETVLPRQHNVQHDEVWLPCFELAQGMLPTVEHLNFEAAASQVIF